MSENVKDIKQTGRIMDTEEGKISSSSKFVQLVSSGTSTIPPPAPNSPLTAPAPAPVNMLPICSFSFKCQHLLWGFSPREVILYIGDISKIL